MNAYDATTPSEMLMAFLEGDLEGSHEDILFSLLSGDQALRTEMKELIAVNRLARIDAELMAPPSVWKANVMKEVAGAGVAKSERKGTRFLPAAWYRNGSIALAALLIGIGGTLLFTHSTDEIATIADGSDRALKLNDHDSKKNVDATSSEHEGGNSNASISANVVHGKDRNARHRSPAPIGANRQKGFPQEIEETIAADDGSHNEQIGEGEEPIADAREVESATVLRHDLVDAKKLSAIASTPEIHAGISSLSTPASPNLNVRPPRIEIGYRHNLGGDFPKVALPSTSGKGLGEMSFSILYRLDAHHRIGLEGGSENFPQVFRGIENGEHVRYEQNPTLTWYGLAYEYTSDPILFDAVSPFARLIGGGTTAGPLTRGILGLRFVPESRVAFTAGADGSLMFYEFQENWFTSGSLGFTYGVSLAF